MGELLTGDLMRDPYTILGVKRDAGPMEIKSAWRDRVKETHPDRNIGDPEAAERFAEVGRAYDVLKDPRRRQLFDMLHKASDARGPTDASAQKRNAAATEAAARAKATDAVMEEIAKAKQAQASGASQAQEDAEDMLERIFGVKGKGADDSENADNQAAYARNASGYGPQAVYFLFGLLKRLRGTGSLPDKAPDMMAEAMVTAKEILQQKWISVQLTDGRDIRFQLESGTTDGHVTRIKGQGLKLPDMQRGDVLVKITIARNGEFQVNGHDIHTSLPIKLQDAVLGCEARVTTPSGEINVTVPAWSGSDQTVRLEGKGLAKGDGTFGDFVIELRVILLEKPDDKVTDLMRHMREGLYL